MFEGKTMKFLAQALREAAPGNDPNGHSRQEAGTMNFHRKTGGKVRVAAIILPLLLLHGCLTESSMTSPPLGNASLRPRAAGHPVGPAVAKRFETLLPRPITLPPRGYFDWIDDEYSEILDREGYDECESYDIEYITVEEGGHLEVWDSRIEIPPYALEQDTLMALYIPTSNYIEFWVYPPSLSFLDTVDVTLSYDFADLGQVIEDSIMVAEWVPQIQGWEFLESAVDTLDNTASARVIQFPAPPGGDVHGIYALADHN